MAEHARKIGEPLTDTASYVRTFNDIIKNVTSITESQRGGGIDGQKISVVLNDVQLALANAATEINKNIGTGMSDGPIVTALEAGGTLLRNSIQTFAGSFPNLSGELRTEATTEGELPNLDSRLTKKAIGGGVVSGEAYKIGELGPETFVAGMDGAIIPNMKSMLNRMPDIAKQLQDEMAAFGAPISNATKTAMATAPKGGSVEEKLDILNQTMLQLVNINTIHKDIGNKQVRTMRSAGNLMSGLGRA